MAVKKKGSKKKTAKKTVRKKTVKRKVVGKKATRKKLVKKKVVRKKAVKKKVTRKKAVKKKAVKKKTVKRKVAKKTVKRKVVRKVAKKKGTKRKKARKAVGAFLGKNKKGIINTLIRGGAVVAGAVGAGVAANNLPIKDPRLKAIGVVLAGALLANTKLLRSPEGQALAMGMIASGGISLLKQFAPNVPLLAGEESYYPYSEEEMAMLGYNDELDYEDDYDLEGEEENVFDDETFEGESVNLEGDEAWIDPSMI